MDLRLALRRLWADHVLWTRVVIISALAGLADLETAVTRLMRNQQEIGDAMKPYLGTAAGDHLAALLREHIKDASEAVTALRDKNDPHFVIATQKLYANADEIARFLAATGRWSYADLAKMMQTHINQLLVEAHARATGFWDRDVAATDQSMDHILTMADALAVGLV